MRAAGAAWAMLLVGLGASCTDAALLAEVKALGEGCLIDSDCADELVCVFRTCHYQCVETKDCVGKPGAPEGVLCVKGEKPTNVCQLASEQLCEVDPECPGDQRCGVDGHCRDGCAAAAECVAPQVCVSATCAESDELVNGALVGVDGNGEGSPCSYSSECPGTLYCKGGSCTFECKADKDCSFGQTCDENRCRPTGQGSGDGGSGASTGDGGSGASTGDGGNGTGAGLPDGYGEPCNLPSDCLPFGLICGAAGECVYQCVEDVDCPVAGACCRSHDCVIGAACLVGEGGGGGSGVGGGGDEGGGTVGDDCATNIDCDDGLWCNGAEDCVAGYCFEAPDGPCDSNSACVIDSCSEPDDGETVGACVHEVLAGEEDEDDDGFVAIACTGGSDCDDEDLDVNPEHPEVCDGLDNNCNGLVDDHAVLPALDGVSTPFTGTWGANLPAILPWGSGDDHLVVEVAATTGELRLGMIDDQGDTVIATAGKGRSFLYYGTYEMVLALGPGHALVGGPGAPAPYPIQFSIITATASTINVTTPTVLENENFTSFAGGAAWTGEYYVFGYRRLGNAHYAVITSGGALASTIVDVASGFEGPVYSASNIEVAANGGTVLVAYHRQDTTGIEATVVRPNMGNFFPAATISLPADPYAAGWRMNLIAVGKGFVIATGSASYPISVVYFEVTALNQVVNQRTIPVTGITGSPRVATNGDTDGVDEGEGVAVVVEDGVDVDLLYWVPGGPNPVELTSSIFGPQPGACFPLVAGRNGRVDMYCPKGDDTVVPWRRLGCF